MIAKQELDKLLANTEQDSVEKTISTNDATKFGEAICSFCNDFPAHNKPGYLIVGVNDDGSRCGLARDERILQTLMDFRTDGRIVPPPVIVVSGFEYPDGYVAVAEVQPSFLPPARFKGKVCIRIGPRKGYATDVEERILSEKRSSFASSWDTLPCYGSNLNDMSIEIFKLIYLPTAIDEDTLLANGREIKEQLASLKFYDLKADCPTNAAILMFGTNPRFFISGAYVQYVKFQGPDITSDFDFERKFEGDLTTQLKVIDEFAKTQVVKMVLPELGGDYVYNYPHTVFKELLVNAIIHKDYQSNAPIKFYEFDDRVEISNPGGLYGSVTQENFPFKNDYRNPVLAEAVKNLGYMNAFNVGILKAKKALEKNGNLPADFIINQPTHFEVIIYKKQR